MWSAKLILVSIAATAVLALCAYLAGTRRRLKPVMRFVAGVIPVVVMVSSGIMCVRGYVLDEQSLRVKRLLWDTPDSAQPDQQRRIQSGRGRGPHPYLG